MVSYLFGALTISAISEIASADVMVLFQRHVKLPRLCDNVAFALQWRGMNVMKFEVNGNSILYSAVYSNC